GVKYAVALSTVALITWVVVEQISGGSESAAILLLIAGPGTDLLSHRISRARHRVGRFVSRAGPNNDEDVTILSR
ncbi:MAG: hypothetical protein ABEH64_11115, partial [Salinirussus sp.]